MAAQDIISGEKIINVAYKYGYETPEAFTKAFGKMHGISPSAARELGANQVKVLHHATSGAVTGDYSSVVGYGAVVILKTT